MCGVKNNGAAEFLHPRNRTHVGYKVVVTKSGAPFGEKIIPASRGLEFQGDIFHIPWGKELAFSLGKTLISLGVVKGAVELLARVLQMNVATFIVGKVIQGITAAYLTRIAGKSFVEYFRQDQDWGDGGITEVVQRQFQLSRKDEFIKSFVKDAIAKVVRPLSDTLDIPEADIYEPEEAFSPEPAPAYDDDEW